jgi:serine/threonine protein phosphatase PrpC
MHEHLTTKLRLLLEVATATGQVRAVNEDGVVIDPATGSCAVIDGGGANGALATALVQRDYPGVLASLLDAGHPPEQALPLTLERLSAMLVQANRSDPRMAGSGAAVTALLVHDDHAHVAHCGDARAYLLRDGALLQLSSDHTLVAEMVAKGELEAHEAATHPYCNIVLQVLGFSDEIEVQAIEQALVPGDVILLCTDGLWRAIPTLELEELVRGPAESLHTALIDRAVELSTDNVAVAVARLEALQR